MSGKRSCSCNARQVHVISRSGEEGRSKTTRSKKGRREVQVSPDGHDNSAGGICQVL